MNVLRFALVLMAAISTQAYGGLITYSWTGTIQQKNASSVDVAGFGFGSTYSIAASVDSDAVDGQTRVDLAQWTNDNAHIVLTVNGNDYTHYEPYSGPSVALQDGGWGGAYDYVRSSFTLLIDGNILSFAAGILISPGTFTLDESLESPLIIPDSNSIATINASSGSPYTLQSTVGDSLTVTYDASGTLGGGSNTSVPAPTPLLGLLLGLVLLHLRRRAVER